MKYFVVFTDQKTLKRREIMTGSNVWKANMIAIRIAHKIEDETMIRSTNEQHDGIEHVPTYER